MAMVVDLEKCPRCGSTRLVRGTAVSHHHVAFRPAKITKFFSLSGSVATSAVACLDCGGVHLTLDPAELIKLAGDVPSR